MDRCDTVAVLDSPTTPDVDGWGIPLLPQKKFRRAVP